MRTEFLVLGSGWGNWQEMHNTNNQFAVREDQKIPFDQLKLEHDRFTSALSTLDDGFVIFDKNDRLVFFNNAFQEQFGEGQKFLALGRSFEEMTIDMARSGLVKCTPGKERQFVDDLLKRRRSKPGFVNIMQRYDGEWILQSDKRTPNGEYVGTRTNITELKQREAELEAATKAAELAERAKSEFLANMSHEIRTPMNGVMGMAELLENTELSVKQKMFTEVIVKSSSSLLTIINDVLDFSKIDAGQMELDVAPFNLAEAIEDVATLVSAKVAEKNVELIVRVDPRLPKMLLGDVGRIRQITLNLIGNAIKFTEKGQVYINVQGQVFEGVDANYCKLKFDIEDTGIGIPKDKCDQIFEKFSQVDTSFTRKHEGTGLGLAISSSLVKLMDGEIGVDSDIGKGSTFWFEIKLPVSDAETQAPIIPGKLSGARILIVDDNEVNCSILTEQMKAWEFDSAATYTGKQGLAAMRAVLASGLNLDLVILDYQMPEMSGVDVLQEMRTDEILKQTPVMMLTSVENPEVNQQLATLGVAATLTKPTRSTMLLETILQIIATNRAGKSISPLPPKYAISHRDQAFRKISLAGDIQPLDVLVAEDNKVNQIVMREILEEGELNYKIVENGCLALTSYKALRPRLVLMDISMPEMNGFEATFAIRKFEQDNFMPQTPIIGVTAHVLKGDMEKCIDSGMNDYLSKPVSPKQLIKKIVQWLSKSEQIKTSK